MNGPSICVTKCEILSLFSPSLPLPSSSLSLSTQLTAPTEYYSCPPLSSDVAGICSEECSSDSDCTNSQRCCSNGCGHTCSDPVRIPYVAYDLQCPEDYDYVICDIQECSDSTECGNSSQLCCSNPCGSSVCVDGVKAPFACSAVVSSKMKGSLLGRFVPSCDNDGQFRALQCFSEYCWCVDTTNGRPTSELRLNTNMDDLPCASESSQHPTFFVGISPFIPLLSLTQDGNFMYTCTV